MGQLTCQACPYPSLPEHKLEVMIIRMARSIAHDLSVLCRPLVLGEVQNAFNIKPGGRFAVAVKNPEATSPAGIGVEVDQQADFTEELSATFTTQAPRCLETSAGQSLVRSGRHSGRPG